MLCQSRVVTSKTVLSSINLLIEHIMEQIDALNGGHLFPIDVILISHLRALTRRDREVINFTRSRVKNKSELTTLGN